MSNPRATAPGRTSRRVRGLLAALVLTSVWATTPSRPAAAAACDGVTVRVERSASATVERCASGAPGDGFAALDAAGFSYGFVPGQAGFVCTIDGYPDPCNDAPSDAYWSYWHAAPGDDSWTYSARGGASRTPPPGGADAWVFGDGSRPPSAPPPAPATPSGSDEPDDPASPAPTPTRTPSDAPAGMSGRTAGPRGDDPERPGDVDGTARTDGGTRAPTEDAATDDEPTADGGSADRGAAPERDASGAPSPGPGDDDTIDEDAAAGDAADGYPEDDDPPDGAGVGGTTTRSELAEGDTTAGAPTDAVVVGAGRAGGRSAAGAAAAGLVVAGIAGAGVLRSRRRDAADDVVGPGL